MVAGAIRHSDNIGIMILKSRDYIFDAEKWPDNTIIGQKKRTVCAMFRVFLQSCFPSIKIVAPILPAYYSYTTFRQFFQIFITDSIARTDKYDIESHQRKFMKILVDILSDNAFFIIATKKACRLIIMWRQTPPVLHTAAEASRTFFCEQIK